MVGVGVTCDQPMAKSVLQSRPEQYYWMRYWYWVILGCFRTIGVGIGIVKGF